MQLFKLLFIILLPINILSFNIKLDDKQTIINYDDVDLHKKVKTQFLIYNPIINDTIVDIYCDVLTTFKLEKYVDELTKQICLESSARQYYNDDSVITSSGNAVGISQITPYTAELFFFNLLSKNDTIIKKNCDYNHILLSNKEERRGLIIDWLSDVKNNLYLYGFIMKYNLDKYNSIKKSLVVYSKGDYYLKKCVDLDTVDYVMMLSSIITEEHQL